MNYYQSLKSNDFKKSVNKNISLVFESACRLALLGTYSVFYIQFEIDYSDVFYNECASFHVDLISS